jgi:Domain of unknown function (DUF397)
MESAERSRGVSSVSARPSAGLDQARTRISATGGAEWTTAAFAQAVWRKSSWSSYNGNCVAVASLRGQLVGVRDTKEEGCGKVLVFDSAAWRSFIDSVKIGGVIH